MTTYAVREPDDKVIADRLRAIWRDMLNAPDVQPTDNFVALGGDSIAATMCANRIRTELLAEVSPAVLLMDDCDFSMLVEEVCRNLRAGGIESARRVKKDR